MKWMGLPRNGIAPRRMDVLLDQDEDDASHTHGTAGELGLERGSAEASPGNRAMLPMIPRAPAAGRQGAFRRRRRLHPLLLLVSHDDPSKSTDALLLPKKCRHKHFLSAVLSSTTTVTRWRGEKDGDGDGTSWIQSNAPNYLSSFSRSLFNGHGAF